jgi:hypothetical protein
VTATPKKPRKVVVWAVVWNDEKATTFTHSTAFKTRPEALHYCNRMKGESGRCYQRVVRCEGVLK